ncbi:Hypothetical protein RG1141_PA02290 (plasmid) [Neorhizobium galegae bv. officinalis bv. officinalis str. HAMBI 1141]|uniref:Uncharacterized protein n=1 Tax=Neorhizobium galegae bv. officinalis bv. officinalis str. HAMBI 1141 TaxID=1028801 RepID=A0A068TG01_NEOGA|nr:hypothetical protein [Neorhizobium galegae]MCQ1770876.1 hypothetical protein [Neorhizobium galegae]MCQ1799598.1 hypothetical protein [Neorhizobium galegae]CDN57064.1 Hypothetical protein RG1141_PA02290 [Neorhizobium galegae bv. officinalis bv. officinalis str. HAMBI 1141]
MLELFSAFAGDYLNSQGVFAASTTGTIAASALEKILRNRRNAARDILIDALSKGKASRLDIPEEEIAAVLFRYMRAAEEGAARLNLKLLAAVISAQPSKPGVFANDFLRWADTLSTLRREEILVLGVMYRVASKTDFLGYEADRYWNNCCLALQSEFGLEFHKTAQHAYALLRTGLVVIMQGSESRYDMFVATSELSLLAEMADIEALYSETPYAES